MKTVAIISEYNPFHTGHEYQLKKIRDEFGSDTRIIAIMSGNYTQRGEIAIIDKSIRAECAVRCGVNLVLEIPFPFSASSAEFFARSGVKIADSINVVDYLSFGSETGNVDFLQSVAQTMVSNEYKEALADAVNSQKLRNLGYPEICEKVFRDLTKNATAKTLFSPNNILAIEYIKAIIELSSNIKPHTIARLGADYSETEITGASHQSATAVRNMILQDFNSALEFIPQNAKNTLLNEFNKSFPCIDERLSAAVISSLRLTPDNSNVHDATGGLYNRLHKLSFQTNNISSLIALAETKKYTTARIRRAILYSFFGVTSSLVKELPHYTQVLAMDSVGRSILREIKKMSSFPIITKPSAYSFLSDTGIKQKEFSDKADAIFQITKPQQTHGNAALKNSPFIMI